MLPALVRVYLIASGAHEPRAQTPFLWQGFLTRCYHGTSRRPIFVSNKSIKLYRRTREKATCSYESISRTPAPVLSVEELADEAAEEREERLAEERSEDRDERRALYDVFQASWSDAVYFLERERLEACEAVEVGEADVPVVDYDDRHDGLE